MFVFRAIATDFNVYTKYDMAVLDHVWTLYLTEKPSVVHINAVIIEFNIYRENDQGMWDYDTAFMIIKEAFEKLGYQFITPIGTHELDMT